MFDRIDPCLDGIADAPRRLRVGSNDAERLVGFLHPRP